METGIRLCPAGYPHAARPARTQLWLSHDSSHAQNTQAFEFGVDLMFEHAR